MLAAQKMSARHGCHVDCPVKPVNDTRYNIVLGLDPRIHTAAAQRPWRACPIRYSVTCKDRSMLPAIEPSV